MAEDNKRTQTELEQSLKAQLKLLADYCNQYDAGISGTDKGNERRIDDSYAYNSVYDTFGGGSFF